MEKILVAIAVKLAPLIAEKLMALLPVIAAAVAKAVADQVIARLPDVDLPGLPPLGEMAEQVRYTVNEIPDVDIPVLSDIFDLTEFFKR